MMVSRQLRFHEKTDPRSRRRYPRSVLPRAESRKPRTARWKLIAEIHFSLLLKNQSHGIFKKYLHPKKGRPNWQNQPLTHCAGRYDLQVELAYGRRSIPPTDLAALS